MRRYDASSITIFSQIEGIRKHPSMYLGDIDDNGTLQCFREILQNATDEVTECGGGNIIIRITGNTVLVADEGRGFPIDIHPKTKRPAIESVLTKLHAGGKSGNKTAYGNRTFGVYGVGASVVNALSKRMSVWTYRNRSWWRIDFAKGIITKQLYKARPKTHLRCGSVVEYELDDTILKSQLNLANARHLCNLVRHFSPVDIDYDDGEKNAILKRRDAIDLLKRIVKRQDVEEFIPPITINQGGVRLVCCWVNASNTEIQGYVSGAPVNSGTHIKGLEEAITEAIALASPREAKGCSNVLIGLRAILDVTVDQPSFSGQAKHTLKTSLARKQVIEAVTLTLSKILRKQRTSLKLMLENATRIAKIDEQHDHMKKIAKTASGPKGKLSFPKGFLAALSYPPDKRELFLVEGNSAGTCFVGNTEVLLADDSVTTIDKLPQKFEGISFDCINNVSKKATMLEPRITKMVDSLIEVELSDGTKVMCTDDHLWLCADGIYLPAKDLSSGIELQVVDSVPAKQIKNLRHKKDS